MFTSLSSCLDPIGEGKTYLISEKGTNGSFVYHHLMNKNLKEDSIVYFISTCETLQHHNAIQAKQGINLIDKQFVYIDAIKLFTEEEKSFNLKGIYKLISSKVIKDNSRRILVIIEDLSVFLALGLEIREIVTFATYCKGLTKSTVDLSSLAVLIHVDDDDEDSIRLCNYLTDLTDVLIDVKSLTFGHFDQVHGEISITDLNDFEDKNDLKMHFKLDERNLKLFAPGTSPTIL